MVQPSVVNWTWEFSCCPSGVQSPNYRVQQDLTDLSSAKVTITPFLFPAPFLCLIHFLLLVQDASLKTDVPMQITLKDLLSVKLKKAQRCLEIEKVC